MIWMQTVEIKIRMDCEGCERRARQSAEGMKGVTKAEVDPKKNKLTVEGFVDPKKVLKRVRRKTGKAAVLWPYVPYDTVYHPYAVGAYDKKAPPGYVRNVADDPGVGRASSLEENLDGLGRIDDGTKCEQSYNSVNCSPNSWSSPSFLALQLQRWWWRRELWRCHVSGKPFLLAFERHA
ncbi:Heavy metal-associated isoprenylated plant protein 26 [Platanthera guangdongensis]|uniref:Heavy metal-associated isoprenylated plant protein 26 n=1 Tax=Platanthera guangdongensis TaxID=2320717 RepID=A0ABR2MNX8_9ASPA